MPSIVDDVADPVGIPVGRPGTPWANPYSRPDDHSEVVARARGQLSADQLMGLDELHRTAAGLEAAILEMSQEEEDLMNAILQAQENGVDHAIESANLSDVRRLIHESLDRLEENDMIMDNYNSHDDTLSVSSSGSDAGEPIEEVDSVVGEYVSKPPAEGVLGVEIPFDFVLVPPGGEEKVVLDDFDSTKCSRHSRRVLITGLPGSTTAAQVASGVAGAEGVLNIFVNRDLRENTVSGQLAAVVEFRSPADAIEYVRFVLRDGIWFVDLEGLHHQILAQQILTPSNQVTNIHPRMFGFADNGRSGRSVGLLHFPVGAVWCLLKDFGIRHIIDVSYSEDSQLTGGVLIVEFTNIFESTRFCNYLTRGYFQLYRPSTNQVFLAESPCDRSVYTIETDVNSLILHVERDHIERDWNVAPYNELTRLTPNSMYRQPIPRRHVSGTVVPSPGAAEKTQQTNSSLSEVTLKEGSGAHTHLRNIPKDKVAATMTTNESEYILVDTYIFRRNRGDSQPFVRVQHVELAQLKQRFVLDNNWGPFWDQYSKTQGLDIRSYYAYARVAAERRDANERLGRPAWQAGDMLEQSVVPDFIYSYSHPNVIRQVLNTTN
ncbi:hypothetical protein FLONG3_4314 [Fusarium longipes]|uniref:RRM domain-containing protein n=1 Tax=Fusarium longipes TaxID=694270 RepID=A0A395SZH4_9HYPO|nr:hypothetical protein FLONG3_4314 [Fusarium longipes]